MDRRAMLAALMAAAIPGQPRAAETNQIRLSHGYGIHYLPLMVIRDRNLLQSNAARMGVGPLDVSWRTLDGGNMIIDAMLSGAIDIAGSGAPGFIILWAKARNTPASAVVGVSGLGNGALWLNTNKPHIRSLRDFGPGDKIAVPGIKSSFAAVVLQMAAAKEFGIENYAQLDPMTVSLPHPEAYAALTSGRTEITGHMASPPFSNQEIAQPGVHRVLSTADLLGPITIDVVYASKRFADANPRIMAVFLAAMDEAVAMIAADKAGAAESFVRVSGVKMPQQTIEALLNDPETSFTVAPQGVMAYAQFLAQAGQIKNPPAVWSDMFIPQLHDRAGS